MNPLHQTGWHGNLSLSSARKRRNLQNKSQNKSVTFDPTITTKSDLTECYRIFTDPARASRLPAQRQVNPGTELRHQTIEIHTDGACMNNGKKDARCGSGVWFGPNDPRNSATRIPGPAQSNQVGEIAAIIVAITKTPTFSPLKIISDSKYAIDGLTTHLSHWEDKGWIQVKNAELFKKAAFLLRQRTATTSFQWVKGHHGNLGNEESDKLAKEGAEKDQPDNIDLEIPNEFNTQGAKLLALDQATAYQGIRQMKTARDPQVAPEQIDRARQAIKRISGNCETDRTIWESLWKPVLRIRVRQFLYKAMHQTHMVGMIWGHITHLRQ
jgi:ribonuclease HI